MAESSQTCRIVVLASGNGSNFQTLVDAVAARRIPDACIVRLFYNKKDAFARQRAEQADPPIPTEYFNLIARGFQAAGEKDAAKRQDARERYDAALAQEVLRCEPDLVVLAGWMHVFSEHFLNPLQAVGVMVINLHPALPGMYDGAAAIERAHKDFIDGKLEGNRTGVMVHHVIAKVDRGAPIATREVECREGDTLEMLQDRIHAVEHELLPQATAQVVRGILAAREAG